ncbi:MAG: hypothetical protein BGN88_04865 [Clostridiales bacterium 43-6]|nr:MAG: hypothetical protein BGN88_04865 [Clostridiales bacterium 43-6]
MISIDVGTKKVCVVEGSVHSGNVTLTGWGEIAYDSDVFEEGVLIDPTTLSFLISEIIKRNRMKSKNAVITVTNNNVIMRELILPEMKPKEMQTIVANEMQRLIGSDNKLTVDYIVVEKMSDKTNKVMAYAMNSDNVEIYQKLLKGLKLTPTALDIHSNAIAKLFGKTTINNMPHGEDSIVVADIGYAQISFHGFLNGIKHFDRTEISPVSDFLNEIASITRMEISQEMINSLDFTMDHIYENSMMADTCRFFISRLSDEIQRYLQYMISNSTIKSIRKIYLMGSLVETTGLVNTIAGSLGIEVELLSSIGKLQLPADCPAYKVANAAGALIRY